VNDEALPLSLDPVSNGEYLPPLKSEQDHAAERRIHRIAEKNAPRTGVTRRTFLGGACGIAASLSTLNEVYGARGGFYRITREMLLDPSAAREAVGGGEFILDIQSHHVMPEGNWREKNPSMAAILRWMEGGRRKQKDNLLGISRYFYAKEIFLDSDTTVAVLSALPALPEGQPLTTRDAVETREIVDRLGRSRRLLIHGLVTPNVDPLEAQLEGMERLASEFKISAWKVYTPWGPRGTGWWLDDEKLGIPFVEKARQLGVKVICSHKGFPLPFLPARRHELPTDVGRIAKRFPDVSFIIYHSGYDPNFAEGPYDPANAERGVNCLVKSLEENGIKPNANVYAELGSTWWVLMRRPEQAAHVLGKLLKHVGEDRVVWGTDSIWYGTPQPQIEAFRAFEISEELQEKHGYPALTKAIKAKIFGLNASVPYKIDPNELRQALPKDEVEKLKQAYLENPQRTFATYGPRTRRELMRLLQSHEGCPA
jgi:predicted TIM-barrel fold metal-dependent hydrolase